MSRLEVAGGQAGPGTGSGCKVTKNWKDGRILPFVCQCSKLAAGDGYPVIEEA